MDIYGGKRYGFSAYIPVILNYWGCYTCKRHVRRVDKGPGEVENNLRDLFAKIFGGIFRNL